MRFRNVNYAGMRSTTLAEGLVLRNAADAVQLSNVMRILPQSVGEGKLLAWGSLAKITRRSLQTHLMVISECTQTTYVQEWNFNAMLLVHFAEVSSSEGPLLVLAVHLGVMFFPR